jgi:hypothetical protein
MTLETFVDSECAGAVIAGVRAWTEGVRWRRDVR